MTVSGDEVLAVVGTLAGAALGFLSSLGLWKLQRGADKSDRLDATVRAAYLKVLQGADASVDGVQELKRFPTGRPHIERSEVISGAVSTSQPQYMSIPRPNGDYSVATQLLEEAQRLKSEATIDLVVEREADACLDFFDEHFYQVLWDIYDVMVGGSGYTPDLEATLKTMRDDQKQLAALARQGRVG